MGLGSQSDSLIVQSDYLITDWQTIMRKIEIESRPDAARLARLRVNAWPEWASDSKVMPWKYYEDETSYIVEGRAIVTPEGGDPIEINKGNLVTFPSGMTCVWDVIEPLHKRYRIG